MHQRGGAYIADVVLFHLLDRDPSSLRQKVAQKSGPGRSTTERTGAEDMEVSWVQLGHQRGPRSQFMLVWQRDQPKVYQRSSSSLMRSDMLETEGSVSSPLPQTLPRWAL